MLTLLADVNIKGHIRRLVARMQANQSYSFAISTPLRASAEQVWAHASTFACVNRELWPLVRMTFPPAMSRLTPEAVPVGRTAFRSWVFLFGLVPVEFDNFTLVELEPGRGFYEVSRLLNLREWRHRRTVIPAREGSVVRDESPWCPGGARPVGSLPGFIDKCSSGGTIRSGDCSGQDAASEPIVTSVRGGI